MNLSTKEIIRGASDLSLAISMAAAVAIGAAIGIGMKKLFGYDWLLFLGIAWGAGAAVLNFVKAYKRLRAEMKELEENPRYKIAQRQDDEDDD
ncbi:MAG: AtpZ/AtpI family protein [Helicobacteraceae bacterium]|jgi:F0F1-type ATP synthase assembly protein I|nr:AtpZ/AtpI family protein [Helicobacteraceae bacterium]